jgi:hypothetical protein
MVVEPHPPFYGHAQRGTAPPMRLSGLGATTLPTSA